MLSDWIRQFFGRKETNTAPTGLSGTVKYFSYRKGYGFIIEDATKKEIYVHHSGLIDKIRKGDRVLFQQEHNDQGLIAKEVRIVKKE